MKSLICALILLPFLVSAQTVGVKDIPADGESSTTIEVKKGRYTDREFEIVTNEDELEGEAAPLLKEARANWKKACADWKAETKDLNKENQVLSLSCGKMTCTTVAMESTCSSTSKYKVKVRVK